MRAILVAVILAMALLGLVLAVYAGSVYHELVLQEQRAALTTQLRQLVGAMRRDMDTEARALTRNLRADPAFLAARASGNVAALTRFADRQLRHPGLMSGDVALLAIRVLDTRLEPIASTTNPPTHYSPACDGLRARAARRQGEEREKTLSGICLADGVPLYSVILPVAERAQTGYFEVVMDMRQRLSAAEGSFDMPMRLAIADGAPLYQSPNWPEGPVAAAGRLVVEYPVYAYTPAKSFLNLAAVKDIGAFDARLGDSRRLILATALIAVLTVAAFTLWLLQETAVQPLRRLTEHLRRLRQDKSLLAEPVQIRGVAEVVELGRGFDEMTAQLKGVYQDLERMAYTDALTKLPNRARFLDFLQEAIRQAQREHKSFVLFIMDLDRFKDINDTLGHHVGDALLTQVAERLHGKLRESDFLARLGGDEFAVLMPSVSRREATIAARMLLQMLHVPFPVEEQRLVVGGSIGIALYPDHGVDANTLIQRADVAMYAAKRDNSGFAFYDVGQDRHSRSRLELIGELRQALEQNQFELYYQPQICLASNQVVAVEALARWCHPREGLVLPEVFVPLLEQTGLIRSLTSWALRAAVECGRTLQERGFPVTVAVNLSTRDLRDYRLVDALSEQIEARQTVPSWLELEITESALMNDPERARGVLARLSEMGLRLTIDDFGTGYSSLALLRRLPVDAIKIDKSFVSSMVRDADDAAIVRASVDLAHNLGKRVIAEGVENEETLTRLRKFDCDMVQGHHVSRPLTAAELLDWLRGSTWGFRKRPTLRHSRLRQ